MDIRRIDLLAPVMDARLDQCASKGFDGIEPDNIDGYTNDTGFPLRMRTRSNTTPGWPRRLTSGGCPSG